MTDPRYPIGKFQPQETLSDEQQQELIRQITEAPSNLRLAVMRLSDQQLNTPYREGGWTIRQVCHHLADSHMNAYIRFKLSLTEQEPTVKTYHENLWAELFDARNAPIETSMKLLDSLHERWVMFLQSLPPSDFNRTWRHPEHGVRKLDWLLQLYAWHGKHHTAQINALKERVGWTL